MNRSIYQISRSLNNFCVLFLIIFLSEPSIALADISRIVFTTDPQTITPGTLSEAITIQTQDENGALFKTPETLDLIFESSSGSGEFLGGTGKSAQKYMSKNTGNRTFYYKDSSEGNFTITITATGRDSGSTWSASQEITVSASAPSSEPKKSELEPEPKKVEPKIEPKPEVKTVSVATSTPTTTQVQVAVPTPKKEIIPEKKPAIKVEKKPEKQAAAVIVSDTATTSTSTQVIYEAPKRMGFFAKIWDFLRRLFG